MKVKKAKIILRLRSAELGDQSAPAVKEKVFDLFLAEVGTWLTEAAVDRMPDRLVRELYARWAQAVVDSQSLEEANGWLRDQLIPTFCTKFEPKSGEIDKEVEHPNVVNLFG